MATDQSTEVWVMSNSTNSSVSNEKIEKRDKLLTEAVENTKKFPPLRNQKRSSKALTLTEENKNNKTAIYIIVPIAIIILTVILIAVTLFLVMRRHKRNKRKKTDSEAIYNGNELPRRNRHSIPGIENQAYLTHILASKENHSTVDETISFSGKYRATIPTDIKPVVPETNSGNTVYLKTNNITEDEFGYNHLENPDKYSNITSYSYVTIGPGGFKVLDDAAYSHLTYQERINYNEEVKIDNDIRGICNKCKQKSNEKGYENVSGNFEVQSSVYDHAVAGGQDPKVETLNEYNSLNGTNGPETKTSAQRDSYINVTKENNKGYAQSKENENSHLNKIRGTEGRDILPLHKYVNVTKKDDVSGTSNRTDGYEEPVSCTPTYFVLKT